MVVTNATGIIVGLEVTGTYLNANTTVLSVVGTTVTLSYRPYSITRPGTYVPIFDTFIYEDTELRILTGQQINIDTTGLSTGMIVWGSNGIEGTITSIGSGFITLSNYGNLDSSEQYVEIQFLPASPSSATYQFAANAQYTFRTPDTALPFGSYPGAGLSQ